MEKVDFEELMAHAKAFSGLSPEREALLLASGDLVRPYLQEVTDNFYGVLQSIPKTSSYLEGRLENLKATHLQWLNSIFTGPYDVDYTAAMYAVGDAHVRVKLPVEFMAGGMCLIQNELARIAGRVCGDDTVRLISLINAINSVLGFSLMVMQESYQSSSLAEELEKFLAITGMSRVLFNNLAEAYQN